MKKEKAYHAEVLGGITDRLKAHQAKVEELAQKHGAPAPSGDLAAFAAELDDYFVRQYLVD